MNPERTILLHTLEDAGIKPMPGLFRRQVDGFTAWDALGQKTKPGDFEQRRRKKKL